MSATSHSDDTLVSAAELQRAWARLTPLRTPGTLRYEHGRLAFEGADGHERVRVSLEQVTDVVHHRAGFGFWVRLDGRRYFITPRVKPRPGGFNPLYALLRPVLTIRFLWWCLRGRRGRRALTRRWLELLRRDDASGPVRGLPRWIRTPLRSGATACIVLVLPILRAVVDMS